MSQPTRCDYVPGQIVNVEGVVIEYESGKPYGAVLVDFPAATDEAHNSDGIAMWVAQALVSAPSVAFP
jgi:hypothetical protein